MTLSKLEVFINSKKITNSGDPMWKARDVFTLLELRQWKDFKNRIENLQGENPVRIKTIDGVQDADLGKLQITTLLKNTSPRGKSRNVLGFIEEAISYLTEGTMPDDTKENHLMGVVLRTQAEMKAEMFELSKDNEDLRKQLVELKRYIIQFENRELPEKEIEVKVSQSTKEIIQILKDRITGTIKMYFQPNVGSDARIVGFRNANNAINEDRFVFDGNTFGTLPKFGKLYYTKAKGEEILKQLQEYERRIESIVIDRLEDKPTR